MSETREPFLLLVNPRAGAGRADKHLPRLTRALREAGASFDLARTERSGHATEIVRDALGRGVRGIAVVGGDGTLSEAVNGFFDASGNAIAPEAWLGPLSIGTGGDFRRTIGMPDGVEAMVTRMLWAKPRAIDVGWIDLTREDGSQGTRAFLNIASVGAEGLIDRLVDDSKFLGGTAGFMVGIARGIARYRPQRVRISIDGGRPVESRIINVAIANGRCFGGGIPVAPKAEIDDGLFDVVGIALEITFANIRSFVPRLYAGKHLDHPGVSFQRGKVIAAEAVDPEEVVLLGIDGEPIGKLPATFTVRPGALRLRG